MSIILVENQIVKIRWNGNNKDWYVNKGYKFSKFGDEFDINVCDISPSSSFNVKVECDYCHDIFEIPYDRYINSLKKIKKSACRNCGRLKSSENFKRKESKNKYEQFLAICNENNYRPVSKTYNKFKEKLSYICPAHGLQQQILYKIQHDGCSQCRKDKNKKLTNERNYKLFLSLCEERGYIPISKYEDCINGDSLVKYICPKHGEQEIRIKNLKYGAGCNDCRYEYNASVLRVDKNSLIERIESKNNNKLLNPDDYTTAITKNLQVKCGFCGSIFTVSLNNYDKNYTGKCPHCNGSVGEYKIEEFLRKNSIKYETQKTFKDCIDIRHLLFDFYLIDYNLCIEFDGNQHFEPIFGQEHFKKTILHDKIKNQYCKDNNIDLLRIPYWEGNNIEQILIDKLNL